MKYKTERPQLGELISRLKEKRNFIQVLSGPRQVGKTTLITQMREKGILPCHYATADRQGFAEDAWIYSQWDTARNLLKNNKTAVLILDEIHKVKDWTAHVKTLWDEDTLSETNLLVVLLSSTPVLISKKSTESLHGRFEIINMPHWSFVEMRDAFNFSIDEYIYYGGYPGAVSLLKNTTRWKDYIEKSIVEATINKDITEISLIRNPSLMKRLLDLSCEYSSQILSIRKVADILNGENHRNTISDYLNLLDKAQIVTRLEKYSGSLIQQKKSHLKVQVLNSALVSANSSLNFKEAYKDKGHWGRITETAVGSHLFSFAKENGSKLFYWRDGNHEVDFVLVKGKEITAIEVKSGNAPFNLKGLKEFRNKYKKARLLTVGKGYTSLKDFFENNW